MVHIGAVPTMLMFPCACLFQTRFRVTVFMILCLQPFWRKWRMVHSFFGGGGGVGKVNPPHLVMPITVEPSKPCMCHNERFLNCWIKNCSFCLDYITGLPRYVGAGHYQTTFDDKSGYDQVCLHPSSSTFWALMGRMVLYIFHFGFWLEGKCISLPFYWFGSDLLGTLTRCTVFTIYWW